MRLLRQIFTFLRLVSERFSQTRCQQVAESLTYTSLLSVVPLITVTVVFFGNFPGFAKYGDAIKNFMLANLLPDKAGQLIAKYALEFSENAAGLTLMGGGMLLVTALMLTLTIDKVFNQIWGVHKPRSIMSRLTIYWFALTLGPVVFGASLTATTYLVAESMSLIGQSKALRIGSAVFIPILLLSLFFSVLFYAIPNHPVRVLHALLGGLITALLFTVMQRVFGFAITQSGSYTLIYGAFAALPIFLLWLFLSWMIVLLGAVVTANLPLFGTQQLAPPKFSGDRVWSALGILRGLYKGFGLGKAMQTPVLASEAGLNIEICEAQLEEMMEIGWVVRTREGDWVLSYSPDILTLKDVIERFAIQPKKWLEQAWGENFVDFAQKLDQSLTSLAVPLSQVFDVAKSEV